MCDGYVFGRNDLIDFYHFWGTLIKNSQTLRKCYLFYFVSRKMYETSV